ncbi:Hypothetical protein HDN1F_31790 [gamma proteobacterium HdN1]|nr:Hypothetical protein HDN1F_31790 [gamma proteobacterium HdN1]
MRTQLKSLADNAFAPSALSGLANLLDNRFTLPGTNLRVGWDFIIGLVPVVGDIVTTLLSSYILVAAVYHGARVITVLRMFLNIIADFLIGLIPIAGDFMDIGWKTNLKNVRLLLQDLEGREVIHAGAAA